MDQTRIIVTGDTHVYNMSVLHTQEHVKVSNKDTTCCMLTGDLVSKD